MDEATIARERNHLRWMAVGAVLCLILGLVTGGAGVLGWEQRSRRAAFEELQASVRATMNRQGIKAESQGFARYSIACNVSACYRLDVISGVVEAVTPGLGIK